MKEKIGIKLLSGEIISWEEMKERVLNTDEGIVGVTVEAGKHRLLLHPEEYEYVSWGRYDVNASGCTTTRSRLDAVEDFAGEANTRAILARLGPYKCPAIAAAVSMAFRDGTKGWLPSVGELNLIMENKEEVDRALTLIGGDRLEILYWTSTQYSRSNAWNENSFGCFNINYKGTGSLVRSVASF